MRGIDGVWNRPFDTRSRGSRRTLSTVDESVLVLLDTGGSVLWARMPIFACHVDPPESSVKLILRDPEIATAWTYATASPEQHSLTVSGLDL